MDRDEVVRVLRAFDREGLEYVLIGAAAMAFHGVVRATEDMDVFIRAAPENVERLGDAASYDSVEAEIKSVDGVPVRVATPLALVRLKQDTVRAIDRQDAAALRRRFNLDEEQ